MLAFIMLLTTNVFGQSITLGPTSGGGATYRGGPIYRFSTNQSTNYSRFVYLYSKSELNIPAGSTITKIEWIKQNNASASGNNTFKVAIANTSKSVFSQNEFWEELHSNATSVYESTNFGFTNAINSPITINFNKDFIYSGEGLLISTDWKKGGICTGPLNFYLKSETNKSIVVTSSMPFPASSPNQLLVPVAGHSRPTIRIYYVAAPPCNGNPNAGLALNSKDSVCKNDPFTLFLEKEIKETGINYKWEKSSNSDFSNSEVIGTTPSLELTQTTDNFYRCILTCNNSNLITITNTIKITMKQFYNCYCPSTAKSPIDEDIVHFKFSNLDNFSGKGIEWIPEVRSGDCGELAPGYKSVASLYSNYTTLPITNIVPNTTVPYVIETDVCGNTHAYNMCAIYLDLNRNGIFENVEQIYTSSVAYGPNTRSGYLSIPYTAEEGLTGLRVILSEQGNPISSPCGDYSFGETEDYLVNLTNTISEIDESIIKTASITNSSNVCKGSSLMIYPDFTPESNDVVYTWYKNGELIPNANNFFYKIENIQEAALYQSVMKNNSIEYNTVGLYVGLLPFTECYCSSTAGTQADEDIMSITLNDTTVGKDCRTQSPGENSFLNEYSDYKPNGAFTTLQKNNTYSFSIRIDDCDIPASPYYSNSVSMWIDYNHNSVFNSDERVLITDCAQGPRDITGTFTIPSTALSGNTVLRAIVGGGLCGEQLTPCSKFQSGETEDHLIKIVD